MAGFIFSTASLIHDVFTWLHPTPNIPSYGIPLPPIPHQVIHSQDIQEKHILIIGDIHACFDEFKELIVEAKKKVNNEAIHIVCVGDMLNKGPKNFETVKFLQEMFSNGQLHAVRGNHEESILREYMYKAQNYDYSFPPKYHYLNDFSESDFAFLSNLPYSLRIPRINAVIVHAGLVPNVPLEKQKYGDITRMRNLISTPTFLRFKVQAHPKTEKGVAWATKWEGPEHVYFGHDAKRKIQDLPFATGLDSGCLYGNFLTGIIIDSSMHRSFVHVEAKQKYQTTD